jgi:hypothetical protein
LWRCSAAGVFLFTTSDYLTLMLAGILSACAAAAFQWLGIEALALPAVSLNFLTVGLVGSAFTFGGLLGPLKSTRKPIPLAVALLTAAVVWDGVFYLHVLEVSFVLFVLWMPAALGLGWMLSAPRRDDNASLACAD